MLIPEDFFKEQKKKVCIELPFCPKNEELTKTFLEKFHAFTKNNIHVVLKRKTKKVKQFFKLKSPNPHPACKIYYGECSCGETYISETVRNVKVIWKALNHRNIYRPLAANTNLNGSVYLYVIKLKKGQTKQ